MIRKISLGLTLTVAAAALLAVSPASCQEKSVQEVRNTPVTVDLSNVPIAVALKGLFSFVTPTLNYNAPNLEGTVSLSLNNVPFEQALRSLCRVVDPPLTYRRIPEGNIYEISVKKTADTTTTTGVTPTTEIPPAEVEPERKLQKIVLQYATAADIGQLFGVSSVTSRAAQFTLGGGGNYSSFGNSGFGNSGFGNNSFGNNSFGNSGFGGNRFGGNNSFGFNRNSGYGRSFGGF